VICNEIQVAKWTVGKLTSDKTPTLTGPLILQPQSANVPVDEAPPITMNWKVPMASVSGLTVQSLQLLNEAYKPYKGVRTVAKSGKFQIRSL
jgi:AP-3 complex subunit mu